jgi:hypothetical protein
MKAFRADQLERGDPVWVWDGSWLAAGVADVALEPGRKFLIVQFENGGSAPASWADIELRDPDARGTDKPRSCAGGRGLTSSA